MNTGGTVQIVHGPPFKPVWSITCAAPSSARERLLCYSTASVLAVRVENRSNRNLDVLVSGCP
jgi:hypothetical protein